MYYLAAFFHKPFITKIIQNENNKNQASGFAAFTDFAP